ncbi:MAG TPA: alpha/beta fold hydrolase [Myxococcales bacterium]|nr:alpha/beta fold hydrolase [Myxococcales bacterium]HIN85497.1 alpha/beta fold hydrolase [Myxococcales bacterium]
MRLINTLFLLLFLTAPVTADVVKLKTKDGLILKADWHAPSGKKHGVIVALHMFEGSRQAWKPLVEHLKSEGMGLLAIDLRGHGDSAIQKGKSWAGRVAEKDPTLFAGMHQDVAAGMSYLRKKGYGPNKVVLVGAHVGSSVALHYASKNPRIKAAILLSPGEKYFELDSRVHLKKWGKRAMLIVSSKEAVESGARPLYKALPHKDKAVLLMLPQKRIHGTNMFGKVPGLEQRIVEWSAIQLGKSLSP